MNIIYQLIFSFFATIGFVIYFSAPLNSVFASGITGGLSWIVLYICLYRFNNKIIGTFLGALLVGTLGEYFAIRLKKPATVFITPGIVALVPGAGMYYTMLYLVQRDFEKAAISGTETFFMAAAIAIGIIASSIFSRFLKRIKKLY
ncbi:MAG: threonine/serine exporter family protein [Tissierellaceae bacterium]